MTENGRRAESPTQDAVAACCTEIYGHPLTRMVFGPSWHPGGLALTEELARQAGLQAHQRVLDAGTGHGTSAIHLAKQFGCHVIGITLEQSGLEAGERAAQSEGVEGQVTFELAALASAELEGETFDMVLMECVLSSIVDKPGLLARLHRSLKPGASLVLSDVILDGDLPFDVGRPEMTALCLAGALPLDTYGDLLDEAGFSVAMTRREDHRVAEFMRGLKAAMLMAEVASRLGKIRVGAQTLAAAKDALHRVEALVSEGTVGYGSAIAVKR